MTSYVFVTGGVVSSVGKGIAVASLGRILKSRGLTVSVLKLDPYLNVDPGTMSPYQHGEVFVTDDGCETDLDLGHYERFIDVDLTELSNVTAGQVYSDVISRERRGEFLGGTIQAVPHVTDAIKKRILRLAGESGADVIVTEVGEAPSATSRACPFLEAIRQMRNEVGRDNVFYIHVTYLPYIGATGELKTKPTQHSVRELRSIGIQPDAIVCRSDHPVEEDIKDKIAVHCDVLRKGVIALPTVESVYEVPLLLEDEGLGELDVGEHSVIRGRTRGTCVALEQHGREAPGSPSDVRHHSRRRQVRRAARLLPVRARGPDPRRSRSTVTCVDLSAGCRPRKSNGAVRGEFLEDAMGIVVPGGFGERGVQGMIGTVEYARRNQVPYLGLCLGMQVMVIEAARALMGLDNANSTEFDSLSPRIR